MDAEDILQNMHRVPTKTPKKAKTANKADSGLRNGHPSESINEEAIDLETTKVQWFFLLLIFFCFTF